MFAEIIVYVIEILREFLVILDWRRQAVINSNVQN